MSSRGSIRRGSWIGVAAAAGALVAASCSPTPAAPPLPAAYPACVTSPVCEVIAPDSDAVPDAISDDGKVMLVSREVNGVSELDAVGVRDRWLVALFASSTGIVSSGQGGANTLSMSSDGSIVGEALTDVVSASYPASGYFLERVKTATVSRPAQPEGAILAAALSGNGQRVALAMAPTPEDWPDQLVVLDLPTNTWTSTPLDTDEVDNLGISSDGSTVVWGDAVTPVPWGEIHVLDVASGTITDVAAGVHPSVDGDGGRIAFEQQNQVQGEVADQWLSHWDRASNSVVEVTPETTDGFDDVHLSTDGTHLIDDRLSLVSVAVEDWQVTGSSAFIAGPIPPAFAFAVSNDGDHVIYGVVGSDPSPPTWGWYLWNRS